MLGDTRLTPELADVALDLEEKARSAGLDMFKTIFEMIDYNQLAEIAAYGGFPTRYPHWRFGMEFERISKSYTYGLSIIYEMVINNDPCYAYLLRANSLVLQKTVISHVFGHCDFFKNNFWFSKTNRKMLDQMANHSTIVKRLIDAVGHDEVESFIDCALSLENLIDQNAPFKQQQKSSSESEIDRRNKPIAKMPAKKYMDSYINPEDFLEHQRQKLSTEDQKAKHFPSEPDRDVIKFLIAYAPVSEWQKQILNIIRDESYYFAPQGQTKILNEGWATYWHSLMMTNNARLKDSEIVDYCDHYSGVVASHPGSLNPYRLGVELLRHVKRRWDRGQFGLEYLDCDDPRKRAQWDTQAGLGDKKLFEIRKFHNDITFIDEFLDEDFCHETKMFLYDYDRRTGRQVISSRNFRDIKQSLLGQLTNFGQPMITVNDGNFRNRSELLLKHAHEGVDLKQEFTNEVLKNIYRIWKRPVHLETVIEDIPRRVSYDGSSHQIEKI
jgi:stage V sporulation protein R